MFCHNCGAEVAEGARFCAGCGAGVRGELEASRALRPVHTRRAVLIAAAAVALLALGALVFHGLLRDKDIRRRDVMVSNIAVGHGHYAAAPDGEAYFFSSVNGSINRVAGDSLVPEPLFEADPEGVGTVWNIVASDERVYFVHRFYNGDSQVDELCSMGRDGSDLRILCSADELAGGSQPSFEQLYLYDGRIYAVTLTHDVKMGDAKYQLVLLDSEGRDAQVLSTFYAGESQYTFVVTPERVYYTVYEYTPNETFQAIYAQDLDGSDFEALYQSEVGLVGSMVTCGNFMVFNERNHSAGRFFLKAVPLSGGEAVTLREGDEAYAVVGASRGEVILMRASRDAASDDFEPPVDLAAIDVSGGDVRLIAEGLEGGLPSLGIGEERLVFFGNGHDIGSIGLEATLLDYEGHLLGSYALDGVEGV